MILHGKKEYFKENSNLIFGYVSKFLEYINDFKFLVNGYINIYYVLIPNIPLNLSTNSNCN